MPMNENEIMAYDLSEILSVLRSIDEKLSDIQPEIINRSETDYTGRLDLVQVSLDEINAVLSNPASENYETMLTESIGALDYTEKLQNMTNIFLIVIFFLGILGGLISGKIMWEKVRV